MPIALACICGYKSQVKDEYAGKNVKCPVCEATIRVRDPNTLAAPPPLAPAPAPLLPPAPVVEDKVWEYKILTQKDKWFSGKFDPETLEQALNAYSTQGWRMRGMATASVPGFGGNRDELIFVLER